MYLIGNIAIYLGVAISIYGLIANALGIKRKSNKWLESARGAVLSLAFVSGIASFLLFYILGTSQFQFKYVASYTNESLPLA